MIRRFAAAIALAIASCSPAPVLAAWGCIPSPPIPLVTWPESARIIKDAAGSYVVSWWCENRNIVTNAATWRMQQFIVLSKFVDTARWGESSLRVLTSSDPLTAANAELLAAQVVPAVGSQDEYEVRKLAYTGCLGLLRTTPISTFDPPLTDFFCGAVPTPPVAPPSLYVVASPGSVYTFAAGAVVRAVVGKKAPIGARCLGELPVVTRGTTLYFPYEGGLPNEATTCKRP